jgi:hypothetical protein
LAGSNLDREIRNIPSERFPFPHKNLETKTGNEKPELLLSAGNVGEEAETRIGLHEIVQLALHAINRNQPNFFRVQPQLMRKISNQDRTLNFQGLPMGPPGKQLSK